MQSFILIDLNAQIGEVNKQIENFSREEIIAWLQQHGRISTVEENRLRDLYCFTSSAGISINFRLTDNGEMYILHDHTFQKVR